MSPSADEPSMLRGFLDVHRETVARKCEGLGDELAHTRVLAATSPLMSVAGLVSHLRWVEHWWYEHLVVGGPLRAPWTDEAPDADFEVAGVPLARLIEEYAAQCARSNEIVAAMSLDDTLKIEHPRRGPLSVRWVQLHMIEETAQHNGHLDIMRELLDGSTGD
jgi:hypothetical protein